ncbi:MAG: glycosyltransferase family 4 protein [Bacilli bacterium]|nr:glycosyltransferase family 4 protein [Bacilli bacterium]
MSRTLFLNRRFCPGEAWTNRILAYAKGLSELGEEVILFYLISDSKRTLYNINIPGIKVVNLWEKDGFFQKKIRALSFLTNLYRFKKYVRKGDKVFMYGGYDYQLKMSMALRKRAKVFCEITEHPKINGTSIFKINLININRALKKLNGLFVISNSLKNYYEKIGVSSNKIHISNMFVDTSRFIGLTKTTNQKYIAYCGTVSYNKDGVNILIEAFAKFIQKHPEYKLLIIGKAMTPIELDRLKELSKFLGVEQNVEFTGAIHPDKIPQILFNANILALSRPDNLQAQNGFPTKLGEYLATGNPVVVTRVGEIPLFIKHGINGYLSNPDVDSFATQLTWVADNYKEALSVGQKGKELVFNDFSYLSQSRKVLNVINQ